MGRINGHVDYQFGLARYFSQSRQYLAVVYTHRNRYSQTGKNFVVQLYQLHFLPERLRAYHIGIALVKLAETTFLRTVGTPYGLHLEPLERKCYLTLMLYHIACKRHREVITQGLFAYVACQVQAVALR